MEKPANKSYDRAMAVLAHHLWVLEECCAGALQAVVLTGSLVTGCYTGDAGSDIDLVHILRDDAPPDARARALDCIDRTERETNCDLHIARVVYRQRDLYPPYPADFRLCLENKDYIELPVELLRLKDAARVVWGAIDLNAVPAPNREAVTSSLKLGERWAKELQEAGIPLPPQENLPVRLMVQSVLVRALLDVFFATGCSCSSKADAAGRLREGVPGYAFLPLVEACTRWRYAPECFTQEDEQLILTQWPRWREARSRLPADGVPLGNV